MLLDYNQIIRFRKRQIQFTAWNFSTLNTKFVAPKMTACFPGIYFKIALFS